MTPIPDELLARLSAFVEAQLGLAYPPSRRPDLERGLSRAAAELGSSNLAECAEWFLQTGRTEREIESLTTHLTIGETYFFRDPKSFEALENHILPLLVRERRNSLRRLRIWSAGCCTGEEAYSIAMSVARAVADFAEWEITILGTDVNPQYLERAAEGIYTAWSFRGVSPGIKERYFTEIEPGRFEIRPEIKKLVTFSQLNFAEDAYPSPSSNTFAMDVIFCRNVLMYFSRGHAEKVVGNLRRSLAENGWFVASATEASPDLFQGLKRAEFPEASIYRKVERPAEPASTSSPADGEEPRLPPLVPAPPVAAATVKQDLEEHEKVARELADRGQLDAALAACDQAIAADRLDPAHHYLRGVILQEQGAFDDAARALQAAIYLDSDFVIAHFAMGNLLLRLDRLPEAARSFEAARALLETSDPGAVLPHSEGLTAARLLSMIPSLQEVKA